MSKVIQAELVKISGHLDEDDPECMERWITDELYEVKKKRYILTFHTTNCAIENIEYLYLLSYA